ncbi:MAG TPA: alpha-glucan family phosphorylase [Ferrovibrio sp.]|jgi:starch phosphorylase|uniref:alpha-glucan family phosphorylase n=1 Tax=Ferrovibrio sp. TaxID=1917215 RepID=UPI002B4AC0F8|nr:alpha-glucan family phosphorylase [Ferrovibrio sp.]HLT77537.1 alpha-glucan family phosphorylase [Ferrovibrio sp.]
MPRLDDFALRTRIAYFSMEIAIRPEMRTYSGGLGILAGDTARSSADLGLPIAFVTLASHEGYLRQEIDAEGWQHAQPDPWAIADWAEPLDAVIAVRIEGRPVWIRPWLHALTSKTGHSVPVILLDTRLPQNSPEDRTITDRLYGGDSAYRLKQEIVLGIGGEQILHALGFRIRIYHLNEGHAALLAVSLLRRNPVRKMRGAGSGLLYEAEAVRQQCAFTTHTPVEVGHDKFSYEEVERHLGGFMEIAQLKLLAGDDRLNMTRLALNLSGFVNGVALRHAETARKMFPDHNIQAITNGVHGPTWAHPALQPLFDRLAPGWELDPLRLSFLDQAGNEELWEAHKEAKAELIRQVEMISGVRLDPALPILSFARRMTAYKRPLLLLSDPARLRQIAARTPFQIVMAGKAHPHDSGGRNAVHEIHRCIRELAGAVPMVFLPNYGWRLGHAMVSGSDLWLNTPMPPLEASGTSGMKAALNGVLNFSVLDGWWGEAWMEGVTGWAIGQDGGGDAEHRNELYDKLERVILPLWYGDRARWLWMMKQSISKIGTRFSSHTMMRRYASEAYLR